MRGRPHGSKNGPKKPKPQARRVTFTQPHFLGTSHTDFHDLVQDSGGFELVSKDLRISIDLLKRFANGSVAIPHVTWLALWWQSWRGFDQAFSETHNTHMHNFAMRRTAELERYILSKVMLKAIEALPTDHPVGEMLALGVYKAKHPPPLTQLQMEFMEPSISGVARFPFITPSTAIQLETKLRNAGLLTSEEERNVGYVPMSET